MSAPLFFEIRNELLAVALRATLNESYAGRVVERTGVVMGSAEIMVSSQRYDLNSAGNTLAVGGALLVQNIGRAAAAVYAPVRAGGTQAISGAGAFGPVSGYIPGSGIKYPGTDNWANSGIGSLPEALSPRMTNLLLLDNGAQQSMTLRTLDKTLNVNASLYNVVDYGALGDGATDDTSAIGDTYTLATAAGGSIYFPRGTYPLDTTAFASDVGLTFAPGAMLTIPTGESVTINGPINAGDQQIFTGDGNVYINNATGINAMWFGVSAANAAADNDAAFARLLRGFPAANATTFDAYNVPSTTTGQVVKLPAGIIEISATVDITNIGGLTMHGADAPGSHGSTFLAWTGAAAGTMVLMDGTPGSAIGYMHLLGRGIANVGLLLERSNSGYIRSWSTFSNITVSDCAVAGIQISSEDAINLRQVDNIQFYNTLILRCHTGVLLNNRNDLDIHFFTLRVAHNGQAGGIGGIVPTHALWIKYGSCTIHGFDFGGPSFNDFADYAIYLQNGSVQVFGGYSENAKLIKADSTNPSGAIDTTGHTTVGSYVITNMTDTSDFAVFDRVVIDKGVLAAGSQCEVVSKTADSLTVTAIGTSNETNVTVQVAHAPDSNVMSSTLFGFNHLPSLELEAPDYCVFWNQAEKSLNIISSRIGQYIYEGTYSGGINVTYSQIHNVPTWTGRTRFSSVRNTRVLRYYGGTGTDFIMNWEGLTGSHTADVARDVMISSNNFYRRDDYLVPLSAGLGSILRQVDSRLILYQQYADYAGQLIAGLSYSHDVLYPIVEAGDSAAKGYHLNLGPQTMTFRGIAPTSGAWGLGSVIWNTALSAGQSMGWMCTAAGTFGSATDSTGVTAIGSRVITGVTDTEDFNVGDWVTVDKGILYHPGPFEILAKTASTITVNSAGDSVETNVTIATSDPVFEAMPVLSSGHPVVTLGADAGALLGISGQELSLDAQTANTVFAGPASGAAADPTFRALTLDDMPAGIGGGSDAADVTYTPTTATDWDSDADPGNVDDALDQLADRVSVIEGDLISVTYDELAALASAQVLQPLAWYRITDFKTKHYFLRGVAYTNYSQIGDQPWVETVTLTGASGTAWVGCNNSNRLATFSADLATTASNFVTSHSAHYTTLGITVTSSGADLIFTSDVSNESVTAHATVANASGDLAGTVSNTQGNGIHTGPEEVLIVQAASVVAFSAVGYSELHATDIITYDWDPNNWLTDLSFSPDGANIISGWKGVIVKRYDSLHDVTAPGDWRYAKVRRWLNTDTDTYVNPDPDEWWGSLSDPYNYNNYTLFEGGQPISVAIAPTLLDPNNTGLSSLLPNSVFFDSANVYFASFGAGFASNTILGACTNNRCDTLFYNNLIGTGFTNNSVGNNFYGNLIGEDFRLNSVGANAVNAVDFTSATHVYAAYNCEIFLDAAGTPKLRYTDSSGNVVIAAPNGGAGVITVPAGAVPVGGIIMWSGTVATIPANWALCNGSNSTPDLRDRFIVGAKEDDSGVAKTNLTGSLTASGGSVSHHHANHAFTQPSAHSNHTFTQPTAHGTLTHTTGNDSSTTGGTAKVVATTHTLTNNHSGGAVDAHSAHSGGAVDAHDTLSAPQPYYALAFIMRTA